MPSLRHLTGSLLLLAAACTVDDLPSAPDSTGGQGGQGGLGAAGPGGAGQSGSSGHAGASTAGAGQSGAGQSGAGQAGASTGGAGASGSEQVGGTSGTSGHGGATAGSAGAPVGPGGAAGGCQQASDCGQAGVCHTYACTQGACIPGYAPAGTVVPTAAACRKWTCDGQGRLVETIDDKGHGYTNLGTCEESSFCSNGAPGLLLKAKGAPCGSGTCDMGNCSSCTQNADCGVGDACLSWVCSAGKCTIEYSPQGTHVDSVSPKGCWQLVCDDKGTIVNDQTCPSLICNSDGSCCDCTTCPTLPGCS